ncbi:MAG: hypothetical protein AAGF66_02765, partial [Cyanobacteria bacterium P01_H01_bin.119]
MKKELNITADQATVRRFSQQTNPDRNWLAEGVRLLAETPNCGLVGGNIKLFFQNPARPTMVELYESFRALPQREFVET